MMICDGFEVINIADEYLAVPVGEKTESFQGVVVLSEAAAFLLEHMRINITEDELINLLVDNYDIDKVRASKDLREMLNSLNDIGLIIDC